MSEETEEPTDYLSDRTRRYGRAVLIWGCISTVLFYLPDQNLTEFKPFGLPISENNEKVVWLILIALILYNGWYFAESAAVDLIHWGKTKSLIVLQHDKAELYVPTQEEIREAQENQELEFPEFQHLTRKIASNERLLMFYRNRAISETLLPFGVGIFGIVVVVMRIYEGFFPSP